MMSKEELRVMENSKELWDKEPTDDGQRTTRLTTEEGYTCNFEKIYAKKRISDPLFRITKTNFCA